jgi:thiol:disulfide interchange protein
MKEAGRISMRSQLKLGFAILCALFSAVTCFAQQTNGSDVLKPVTVKTDLYPATADANKEIEEALKVASSSNQRVMLIFGGNWCYDCHVLDQALHDGEAGKIFKVHYLLVHVDIGEGNKNLELVKKYETTLDFGVPTVVLLNGSGRVIYSSTKGEFEPARRMMKKDLIAFLNEWKAAVLVRP